MVLFCSSFFAANLCRALIAANRQHYRNPSWVGADAPHSVLMPICSVKRLRVWSEFYLRFDESYLHYREREEEALRHALDDGSRQVSLRSLHSLFLVFSWSEPMNDLCFRRCWSAIRTNCTSAALRRCCGYRTTGRMSAKAAMRSSRSSAGGFVALFSLAALRSFVPDV